MHKFWIHLEVAAMNYGANQLEANEKPIVDFVNHELAQVKGSKSLAEINSAIKKKAGFFLGGLISGELETIESEGGAQLAQNVPALLAKVVAGIRAKAAALDATTR